MFAENLVGLGFLWSVFYIKSIPTPRKKKLLWVKKVSQNAPLNLFFLGLGWHWVGAVRRFHDNMYTFFNPTEFW